MRPRVLVLAPYFYMPEAERHWKPRFDPLGGMHLISHSFALAMAEAGFDQVVLTMGLPGAARVWRAAERVEVHRTRLPVLPIPDRLEGYWGLVAAWGLGSILWTQRRRHRLAAEVGLVHAYCDGSATALLTGVTAAWLLRAPLLLHIASSSLATQHPTTLSERLSDPLAKRAERWAARRAAVTVTLTDRTAAVLRERAGVEAGRVWRIAGLTETDLEAHDAPERRDELAARFRMPQGKVRVLFLGRIASEKGCEHFVRVAARLDRDRYHFVICGDGPMRGEIERLIRALGLEAAFTITGFVRHDAVPSMIRLCDVGAVPSEYEELGLTIVELMTMRCPVVAHDVGGVSEFVVHGETGLLVGRGDTVAMAAAIERLATDRSLAGRLTANAYRAATSRFGFRGARERLAGLYRRLLSTAPVPRAV